MGYILTRITRTIIVKRLSVKNLMLKGLTLGSVIAGLTKVRVYNRMKLIRAVQNRPEGTPLITVSNHHSCLDEPLLWGILDVKQLTDQRLMRWALSAHDICFTKKIHSDFFAYGKSIPVVRGAGVYQQGMNFCLERLKEGSWVHIYPEGRVNMSPSTNLRLKWGVGRLIADSSHIEPIVIPIYHLGMHKVLPNTKPYIPRPWKTITIVIGDPIPLNELLARLKSSKASDEECRKKITDLIQNKLRRLRIDAEIFHAKRSFIKDEEIE